MSKDTYIVFYTEFDHDLEKRDMFYQPSDNLAAIIDIVDKNPDAKVVYGKLCKIIRKHTEIVREE
jgi:hypothetical protein